MKLHLPVSLRKALLACFSVVSVCTLYSGGIAAAADLTLDDDASLSADYADSSSITDMAGGTLTLAGGTNLLLSSCGEGDGKTYTLLTGVGGLLDAAGNPLTLTEENNAASLYFDTTQPGTGFWADATLLLNANGTLQLVRHNAPVMDAVTITSRRTNGASYRYYKGVSFENITFSTSDDSACGGAIYGSTITLSGNGSVTFSGNTASSSYYAYGGAIYGDNRSTITLSGNGSVEFSGNTASSSGGAIYGYDSSTITLRDYGSVTFSENTASFGGAIYGDRNSTIELSGNDSVEFRGNTASSGGAIDGYSSTITLNDNGSVTFFGNTASSFGGAIYGRSGSTITLSGNDSVEFSGNTASSSGGAIYGKNMVLEGNQKLEWVDNTATSSGGALAGDACSIAVNNNGSVLFSNNRVASSVSDSYGGGICAAGRSTISFNGNESVIFERNSATSDGGAVDGGVGTLVTMSGNDSVQFIDNVSGNCGGAIDADVDLNGNKSLLFENNEAREGGAIRAGEIVIQHNDDVQFRANVATLTGGAIKNYGGNLFIRNNGSVLFEKNREVNDDFYRLRSIYAEARSVVQLSAAAGEKIEFRDGLYIGADSDVVLNAMVDMGNETRLAQTGDIILTGKYTESHLNEILKDSDVGRMASQSEIETSRMLEVRSTAHLYDGRLLIQDGAVYGGTGITVHSSASGESSPTLSLSNAHIRGLSGTEEMQNSVQIQAGGVLELSGVNTAAHSSISMQDGSTLRILLSDVNSTNAALTLQSGSITAAGQIELNLQQATDGMDAQQLMRLITLSDAGLLNTVETPNFVVTGGIWSQEDVRWIGSSLYLNVQQIADLCWTNASGNAMWDINTSENWEQHNQVSLYQNLSLVSFTNDGAGNVCLSGELAPFNVSIQHDENHDYTFSGTGRLTGDMALIKQGEGTLCLQTENAYTGGTLIEGGIVKMGNDHALGGGEVVLKDGILDIGGNTLSCDIHITNGCIRNGSLSNNNIMALGGIIEADVNASSSVLIDGDVTVCGSNYGAQTSLLSGSLTVSNSVLRFDNKVSDAYGGAITGWEQGKITIRDNESVDLCNNSSLHGGGAISGGFQGAVYLIGNKTVSFRNNTTRSQIYGTPPHGGAIFVYDEGKIVLEDNEVLSFAGNRAASGGAIYGGTVEISGSRELSFSQNTALFARIPYGGGGATCAYHTLIHDNTSVVFINNSASHHGGAIYGGSHDGVVNLSNNGEIVFSGNHTQARGGAIYADIGSFNICNNGSVLFEKNYETSDGTYRLRGLFVEYGSWYDVPPVVNFSAAEGKRIEFRDSLYIGVQADVHINGDFTDSTGMVHRQGGNIILTGAFVEQHLREIKDGVDGTEAEITQSRTSEITGRVVLHGGSLQVVDGAILKLNNGFTIEEGSGAQLIVVNGSLVLGEQAVLTNVELTIDEDSRLSVQRLDGSLTMSARGMEFSLSSNSTDGFDPSRAVQNTRGGVLDGHLVLVNGATYETLGVNLGLNGGSLTLGSDINIILSEGLTLTPETQVVLFSEVGSITLNGGRSTVSAADGCVYEVNASDYFLGEAISADSWLVYDGNYGVVYLTNKSISVPEPTSATLSLLALSALAARRRRK